MKKIIEKIRKWLFLSREERLAMIWEDNKRVSERNHHLQMAGSAVVIIREQDAWNRHIEELCKELECLAE